MTEQQTDQRAAAARPYPVPSQERSTGQLIGDLSAELSRLVRDEMRLAAAELQQKGKRAGMGAGAAGFAGVIAFLGGAALITAAILGIAVVLPGWLSALIVGGGLLMVAGLLGAFGAQQVKRSTPMKPEEAVHGVSKDIDAVKGVHR